MKYLLFILLLVTGLGSYPQGHPQTAKSGNEADAISFTSVLHIRDATKEGIYINGYVVHLDYNKAKALDGKKIQVTGVVTTIPGLNNLPKEYDAEGNEIIVQGRWEDSYHILSPEVEEVKTRNKK